MPVTTSGSISELGWRDSGDRKTPGLFVRASVGDGEFISLVRMTGEYWGLTTITGDTGEMEVLLLFACMTGEPDKAGLL